MFLYSPVVKTHINTVVVEEDDTITSPVFEHGIDKAKRQSFITPWVYKKEGGNQTHLFKHLYDFFADFFIVNPWLILQ
jgi:hypothetical protein